MRIQVFEKEFLPNNFTGHTAGSHKIENY